jgi:acetyl esterase/lipase
MKKSIFTALIFMVKICAGQQQILLYTGPIPNSISGPNEETRAENKLVDTLTSKVSIPTLSVFLPSKDIANGSAVIICPGGGYQVLLTKREGSDVAKAFVKLGITAFVLKYRLPNDAIMKNKSIAPLQDAQQAIKIVRSRAKEWNIDIHKIGIMGFSAGGHLASTAGTHFDNPVIENKDEINLRPDFLILINPVISLTDKIGNKATRSFLLGASPSLEQIRLFSNELNVNKSTPQSFLVHTGGDTVVPVDNSIQFYKALLRNNVSSELHIYAKGEHGFLTKPSFDEWFGRCVNWLKDIGIVK